MNACRGCGKEYPTEWVQSTIDRFPYDTKYRICWNCFQNTRPGVYRRRDNKEVFEVIGLAETVELREPSELLVVYYHYVTGKTFTRPIKEWMTLPTDDGQFWMYELVSSTREAECRR